MPRLLLTSVNGIDELDGMLFRFVAILSGSAGMTLCTCFTVFKWNKVKSDAGHGTMFMVFFCWFFWSAGMLCRTLLVFMNNRRDTLEHPSIRRMTFLTETFFNATSLWFIAAAYEFQRRALHPRVPRSHRVCLSSYMIVIGGVSMATLAALIVLDQGGQSVQVVDATTHKIELEPLSAIFLSRLSWGSWCIRCVAVGYPAAVALWLEMRRDRLRFKGLPKALSLIVLFFFVLNTPYLIISPLFAFNVLDPSTNVRVLGVMKTFSYMSGIAISVVMGLSVRGFDAFYNMEDRPSVSCPSSAHDSLFVLSSDRSDN
ncbi:unnamed protein product [Aphanomyces euteiches]|uniref:Uncharacterized protein n=1 Tax=Aphanomyces euteiches TaxID=100861 RepID=A0A6G0XC83_9STRA|nr:hypothetical protein Ae201684_006373 [Aphanomyces euteiches]KAH9090830.1 hypothetical protein Ae201684P_006234 [Aphanomyces euteiches]KAH9149785.1 hypothetical protein AeRB84_007256 [Aphanomyces euteiches]